MTRRLIEEAQGGWVLDPEDEAGLRETLRRAHADWSHGRALPRPRPEVVERFDRARLTARLAELLERTCASDRARRMG
jgi:hypothetical protein